MSEIMEVTESQELNSVPTPSPQAEPQIKIIPENQNYNVAEVQMLTELKDTAEITTTDLNPDNTSHQTESPATITSATPQIIPENQNPIVSDIFMSTELEDPAEIPANVANPDITSHQTESPAPPATVSFTNALSLLNQYSSSDEEEEEAYRKPVKDASSSSSSSSSDSEDNIDIKEIVKKIREPVASDGDSDEEADNNKKKKKEPMKVKGEMTIDDLPPIEDLQISVDEKECMEVGTVTSIVDKLALVEALPNSIPLDIDSVLFLDNGRKTLGKVFDVIGPVAKPIYCVRFNTHEEIAAKGVQVGTKIFHAPRTEYTSYVILSQAMTKGSDASWKFDIEPPENLVDYSDDEQERKTKKKSKSNRQQNSAPAERRDFARVRRFLPPPNYQNPPPQQQQQHFQRPNFPQQNHSWHQNFQHPPPPHGFNQQYYY